MTSIIVLLSVVFIIHELNVLFRPTRYDRKVAKIRDDFKTGWINPNHRGFIIFNLLCNVLKLTQGSQISLSAITNMPQHLHLI